MKSRAQDVTVKSATTHSNTNLIDRPMAVLYDGEVYLPDLLYLRIIWDGRGLDPRRCVCHI